MSDTTDKAIDLAQKEMDKITNGLSQLAHQYGPDVIHAVTEVVRINNIQDAVIFSLFVILFISVLVFTVITINRCIAFSKLTWSRDEKHGYEYEHYFDTEGEHRFAWALASSVVSFIYFGVLCICFDIWWFIGIVNPKLFIAHQILQSIK